jgi:hypothetical protein
LGIKEHETSLTLQEHDDDDGDVGLRRDFKVNDKSSNRKNKYKSRRIYRRKV